MKNLSFSTLLLAATLLTSSVQAQVINGDLNHNDGLDVEDVTLLIDGYLSGEIEFIETHSDYYNVDNSLIAGTWLMDGDDMGVTFNEDGTFGGILEKVGYTYKFEPFEGLLLEYHLLMYNESGVLFEECKVLELTKETMTLKRSNGDIETYTRCTENGHAWIDLGLSVKWATMNIGANFPEDYGDYFAWGETKPKDTYDWDTYFWYECVEDIMTKYCTCTFAGIIDNKKVLDPADDAAHVNWGGTWRMPTLAEQKELWSECTWTWTTQIGVNGYKVTGPNGNSIFLPAAGSRGGSSLYDAGSIGGYWSSSLYTDDSYYAWYVYFNSSDVYWNYYSRYYGRSVRAVCP